MYIFLHYAYSLPVLDAWFASDAPNALHASAPWYGGAAGHGHDGRTSSTWHTHKHGAARSLLRHGTGRPTKDGPKIWTGIRVWLRDWA